MTLERVKLAELNHDEKNARIHDERNIKEVMRSLSKHGQFRAFVVQRNGNRVLIGNCMLDAMLRLGWTEAEVYFVDVDDDDATRIALADNQTATLADWDYGQLQDLIKDLGDVPDVAGFDDEMLRNLVEIDTNEISALLDDEDEDEDNDNEEVEENEDDKEGTAEIEMLICPQCGHVNEKRAFRSYGKDTE